jgi:AraC family cel operon transcriptional repressor
MASACVHFKLRDFMPAGEAYHYARTALTADNVARYHDHDYHEVFWVQRGVGEHRINGHERPLRAGTLHLIRPGDRHRVRGSAAAPLHIVNVAFPSRTWTEIRRRYFAGKADGFEQPESQRSWPMDARTQAGLNYWTERLAEPGRPRVTLDGFLMELARMRPVTVRAGGEPVPEWLLRARREIARPEHFAGGTPAFARLAGRTPSHVARAAGRWLGASPTDIVNAARLEHSARQLAETTRPILDIMLDCGLNNLSHFYALFRRRFGLSPRRYRLQAHLTVRG